MPPQARMETESASRKRKKVSITEEDISILQRRYPPSTVLSLLQEVANLPPSSKIDWHTFVKRTNTGITNARECQMLWRYLAYKDTLPEKLELGEEPQDNDSDLEFELEALPAVSSDVATETAQCVKLLIAAGHPSNSNGSNITTAGAPLTSNTPNGCKVASDNIAKLGTSMTHPLSSVKAPPFEGLDGNDNMPPQKKRKAWTKAEDQELTAAVQKCGEGNWVDMLKGDFKGDRTASQMSQRWTFLRKKDKSLKLGSVQSVKSQLTESQLATRLAITHALRSSNKKSGVGSKQNQIQEAPLPSKVPAAAEPSSKPEPAMTIKTSPPRRTNTMRPPDAETLGIQAAAVAAGARIATPSDAASLLAAAHSKKAVHIIPGGGSSLIKSSSLHSGAFPNVHRISSGLPSQLAAPNSIARRAAPLKAVSPLNTTRVSESTEVPLKQEDGGGVKPCSSDQAQKQVETASVGNDQTNPAKTVIASSSVEEKREVVVVEAGEQGVSGNSPTEV